MLTRLSAGLERICVGLLGLAFAALIVTVAIQVAARSILAIPIIWTLDVAQLLFSWIVFIGAGVSFRRGGHYVVDLWPPQWKGVSWVIDIVAAALSAVVIYVLLVYGTEFTIIGLNREAQALAITEAWYFLPIPLGAAMMALFLVERLAGLMRGVR